MVAELIPLPSQEISSATNPIPSIRQPQPPVVPVACLMSRFALQGGILYTAQDGVLLGTVRDTVLKVAAEEGIPVCLQPPNISHIGEWEGVFVTSTSRLMLCAERVIVEGSEELKVRLLFGRCRASRDGPGSRFDLWLLCISPAVSQVACRQVFAPSPVLDRLEQLVMNRIASCSEPYC